jgi:Glycosyltransferase
MRILFLIKDFDFGGAENHVCDLANAMNELGNEVFIIARKGFQHTRLNTGVHFTSRKVSTILTPYQVVLICNFLQKHKIDVIHAHKRLAILQGCLAGKIMNIPVVATVHGRPKYDLRSGISKNFADKIIFVSKRTMEANRDGNEFIKKAVLIHNGVKIIENRDKRDYYSLCYISRHDKRHSSLISLLINDVLPDILKDFPEVSINIIGDGKYYKKLINEASILNTLYNREVCSMRGYIPEVKNIIRKSGLLLGVGRVAIEALSCSVPVLAVNNKFLGTIITESNYNAYQLNNFVPVGSDSPDPLRMKKLLADYFKNPVRYQEETMKLRGILIENLDIMKIASNTLLIYKEVAELKRTSRR